MIKVRAKEGLRVPREDNPHDYIDSAAVEVDGNSLYYRRLIDEGDLEMVLGKNKGVKND